MAESIFIKSTARSPVRRITWEYTRTISQLRGRLLGGWLGLYIWEWMTDGFSFTSASMKTQEHYNTPVYGRIEWRAAMPVGVGMWPGLWMFGRISGRSVGRVAERLLCGK